MRNIREDGEEAPVEKDDNLTKGAKGGAIAFLLKTITTGLAFLNQIILAFMSGRTGRSTAGRLLDGLYWKVID